MRIHDLGLVHDTALIEQRVHLGEGTRVWDNVHIRHGARLGRHCNVGEKTYIAYDVRIGDFVKLNAGVYICAGVSIEDFVMVSAHAVFTNDLLPRAGNRALSELETSAVTEDTLTTRVCRGATIGANATIGPGIELGEFCMVGMGSVVTRDVAPHTLVVGNPARAIGLLCACGHHVLREVDPSIPAAAEGQEEVCSECERMLRVAGGRVRITSDPYAKR